MAVAYEDILEIVYLFVLARIGLCAILDVGVVLISGSEGDRQFAAWANLSAQYVAEC